MSDPERAKPECVEPERRGGGLVCGVMVQWRGGRFWNGSPWGVKNLPTDIAMMIPRSCGPLHLHVTMGFVRPCESTSIIGTRNALPTDIGAGFLGPDRSAF